MACPQAPNTSRSAARMLHGRRLRARANSTSRSLASGRGSAPPRAAAESTDSGVVQAEFDGRAAALANSAVDFLDIRMALEVARIGRAKTAARHQLIFTATGPLAKPEWSGSRRQRRLQVWLLSGSRFLHPTRAG